MKKLFIGLLFYFLFAFPIMASESAYPKFLGTLQESNVILSFENESVGTYSVLDTKYIPIFSLRNLGFEVQYIAETGVIHILQVPSTISPLTKISDISLLGKSYELYEKDIWIGDFKTHGIVCEDNVLIPIGSLRQFYNIDINQEIYKMTPKDSMHLSASLNQITNNLPTPISLSIVDLYWDNGFTFQPSSYELNPLETIKRTPSTLHSSKKYITTLITSAQGRELSYTNNNMYGQLNTPLFERYTRMQNISEFSMLGDSIDIGSLIWAEDTVNQMGLSSNTSYLIWTNLDKQRTYIFEGSRGNWKLIKQFLCSTGKSSSPTPKGTYELTRKVPYFGVEKGYRCKNAFGFIGTTYLYHSVMFDKTGSYLLKGKGELGTPASAGCIRLSVANSEWLYNNMTSGTRVFIN